MIVKSSQELLSGKHGAGAKQGLLAAGAPLGTGGMLSPTRNLLSICLKHGMLTRAPRILCGDGHVPITALGALLPADALRR